MAGPRPQEPTPRKGRGWFVVLDGVDGCGKSTQAELLVRTLARELPPGREGPVHLREPGSTEAGERIRSLLLEPGLELGPAVEALLFAAARRQMLEELVRPAVAAGIDVVCERFHPSTYAYQAVAGELDEDEVLGLLEAWAGEPRPDLVIILDLPVEEARERNRGKAPDRMESRDVEFHRRTAEGFRRYAERKNVVLVSAQGDPEEVAGRVLAEVRRAR